VVGNIVEEQATTLSGTSTTTYDYLGNQLQSVTANGVTQRHFYDPAGNLACVTLESGDASDCPVSTGATPSNQLVAAYQYDPLDRLIGYRSFVHRLEHRARRRDQLPARRGCWPRPKPTNDQPRSMNATPRCATSASPTWSAARISTVVTTRNPAPS
jgi:YD repeat-containing protein